MTEITVVHLLRHGAVRNPTGVLYGRLPGYRLSPDGVAMAEAAAEALAGGEVAALFCSPLERARQTALPIAEAFDLPIRTDERLIEAESQFEGLALGVGDGALRAPRHWWKLRNPFRPSWGEPYAHIVARMLAVMADARDAARGRQAVCVTHQLPIWVTRRAVERKPLWHHPARRQCALASLTSFSYHDDQIVSVSYREPAGEPSRPPPHVPGA